MVQLLITKCHRYQFNFYNNITIYTCLKLLHRTISSWPIKNYTKEINGENIITTSCYLLHSKRFHVYYGTFLSLLIHSLWFEFLKTVNSVQAALHYTCRSTCVAWGSRSCEITHIMPCCILVTLVHAFACWSLFSCTVYSNFRTTTIWRKYIFFIKTVIN